MTALAVLAQSAMASTATISGGNRVNVNSTGNERNSFNVSYDLLLDQYTITDGVGLTASGACAQVDPNTVTCPGAGIASITVTAGGGNDTITIGASVLPTIESNLNAGSGDDRITAAAAADDLDGSSGRDLLDGGAGADSICGGSGGSDTVNYGAAPRPWA